MVPPGTEVDAPAHLMPPATDKDWKPAFDGRCRLYENDGTGHFTDVTEDCGIDYRGMGSGASAADYDNDGDLDLYLTCWGPNRLYRNDGGGKFTDVTETARVGDDRWGVASCWLDYDGDGHLDLYVTNYFVMTTARDPEVWQKVKCAHHDLKVACGPRGMVAEPDVLYRNRGDGSFEDASEKSGILDNTGPFYGLGVVAFDSDRDGDADLYVANDSRANFLFENQGDGTFVEIADFAGVAMSDNGVPQAGMGIAVGDYDNDLDLDLFLTNFSEDDNTLYRNDRRNLFRDITMRMNFGETSYFSLGWGAGFVDFDNDADVDLFVANGHVYPEADQRAPEMTYRQSNRLFRNDAAQLRDLTVEAGPGLQKIEVTRGAAFGDVDNDGDVDVLLVELNAAPSLLINQLDNGHRSILVTLESTTMNRHGIGARVVVEAGGQKLMQEVRAGHSFAGCDDLRLHFGTGASDQVDLLRIVWPEGKPSVFRNVASGRWYHVRQGEAEPEVREWRR